MAGGALILPALRKLTDRASAPLSGPGPVAVRRSETPARADAPGQVSGASVTSAEALAGKEPPSLLRRAARRVDQLVGVVSWTPMVGSLPPAPGSSAPAPFIIGAAGILR
jgi:hypothetical protein